MSDMNCVCITGRLGRDPELKHTGANMAVVTVGVAVASKYKTQAGETREETCWVDIEAWGRTAEVIARYCSKGSTIGVVGTLKLDEWEKDGEKRRKHKVRVDRLTLLTPPKDGGGKDGAPAAQGSAKRGEYDPKDDDIPF